MNAKQLVKKYGKKLIGREVITVPMGDWPGGRAKVVDLGDGNDLSIVMNVLKDDWRNDEGNPGTMGIFEYENISLVRESLKSKGKGFVNGK